MNFICRFLRSYVSSNVFLQFTLWINLCNGGIIHGSCPVAKYYLKCYHILSPFVQKAYPQFTVTPLSLILPVSRLYNFHSVPHSKLPIICYTFIYRLSSNYMWIYYYISLKTATLMHFYKLHFLFILCNLLLKIVPPFLHLRTF